MERLIPMRTKEPEPIEAGNSTAQHSTSTVLGIIWGRKLGGLLGHWPSPRVHIVKSAIDTAGEPLRATGIMS